MQGVQAALFAFYRHTFLHSDLFSDFKRFVQTK